jgi:hypothetical protein
MDYHGSSFQLHSYVSCSFSKCHIINVNIISMNEKEYKSEDENEKGKELTEFKTMVT